MSDFCSLSIRFFQMIKRLESKTKFFFLSSLFVLLWKTKKHFLLSLYAYLNKYRRCCILGKVRPLQIVTTPPSLRLVSSLFQATSKPLFIFAKNKQRCSHLKQFGNIPLVSGGRMSCLLQ